MKDIIISGIRIKTELLVFGACYLGANLLNVYSIWYYETRWIEILTFQRLIIVIALALYVMTWFVRGVGLLVGKLLKKR